MSVTHPAQWPHPPASARPAPPRPPAAVDPLAPQGKAPAHPVIKRPYNPNGHRKFELLVNKVSEQLVQLGWKVEAGKPKSDAGDRTIGLDDETNTVLEAWRKTQIAEQLAYVPGWIRSGRIFTRPDGSELHPAEITKYFNQLVAGLGLPPIRLHDLRHGAATRALEAEVDIKIVQELLGHSTSTLTRDTYTSVSPRLAKEAAEKAARMVPRKAS
jgi:integrase